MGSIYGEILLQGAQHFGPNWAQAFGRKRHIVAGGHEAVTLVQYIDGVGCT